MLLLCILNHLLPLIILFLRHCYLRIVLHQLCSSYVEKIYLALTTFLYGSDFEIDYGSEERASIVYKTLAVDKELQPDKVKREMSVSGGKLVVHFEAVEARFLRASFSAFVDLTVLVTQAC
ncbi:hypothetical protein DAI22_02g137332 [Oryza sativa Japonica Group]|nr:hypothetical protein DAI22_02g137332 [Oryza sativa Japonica Group]